MAPTKMHSVQTSDFRATVASDDCRLETPSMCGYSRGMSSSGVIGRKLGMLIGVPSDTPHEFRAVLRALERKVSSR